jgi:regulator of protease activity HflC (stomatin/prohibitin superfamily)
MSLIIGWILITAGCIAWSYFFHSQTSTDYWGRRTLVISLWSVPLYFYFGMLIIWYLLNCLNFIDQRMRRPVMRFGMYKYTAGPGFCFIDPLLNRILDDVPVLDVVTEITGENIQTKDNVGINLIAALTWRINEANVKDSVIEVEDVFESLIERANTALTDESGISDLDHLLENRANFLKKVKESLEARVSKWGVTIQAFELKNFKIADPEIEKSIAMKARAAKEGEAEVVRAKVQSQVAMALDEAAAKYTAEGRWLKGMETLIELCRSAQNNTILIPTDLTDILKAAMDTKTLAAK